MAANDSEMNRMQQDAIRRVREMQSRAIPFQTVSAPDIPAHNTSSPQQRSSAFPSVSPAPSARAPVRTEQHSAQNNRQESAPRRTAQPQGTVHMEPPRNPAAVPVPQNHEPVSSHHDPEPVYPPAPMPKPAKTSPLPFSLSGLLGSESPVKDFFDMLLKDSDRTLIFALILVLSDEKADIGLIFALMYIAL